MIDNPRPSKYDLYLRNPLFWDFLIVLVIIIFSSLFSVLPFVISDKLNQISAISYLIASCVSLAGFSLAALTVIVTVRANIRARNISEADNALDFILSSKHYPGIVQVFKNSIVEFIIIFISLFCFWGISDSLSAIGLNRVFVGGLVATTLNVSRSMHILFSVLDLEKHTRH